MYLFCCTNDVANWLLKTYNYEMFGSFVRKKKRSKYFSITIVRYIFCPLTNRLFQSWMHKFTILFSHLGCTLSAKLKIKTKKQFYIQFPFILILLCLEVYGQLVVTQVLIFILVIVVHFYCRVCHISCAHKQTITFQEDKITLFQYCQPQASISCCHNTDKHT